MKSRLSALLVLSAAVALLPSSRVQSQIAPAVDVFKILEGVAQKNDELLKKQDETLKTLEDILSEARQARIFSKRG